ncbi:glycosyltransferase [Bacteroidia bacterium]|nr:glycosyltransferase [Bacteroidia bacterium]
MISVVIPIFNGEKYLEEAIKSVLNQTFEELEILLLNDGSTDLTRNICRRYEVEDERVRYFEWPNSGMAETLNKGLKECSYEYVARLDADDIMLPDRLQIQIDYLIKNPHIDVLGTLGFYINESGKIIGRTFSDINQNSLKKKYFDKNEPFGMLHPSIIYKKSKILMIGGYRGEYWPCDDIDLWNRLYEKQVDFDVIQSPLIKYRIHQSSAVASRYLENRMKYRWMRSNMRNRRIGVPEISFDKYLTSNRYTINNKRKDLAKYYYRIGAHKITMDKTQDILVGIAMAVVSLILDPMYVLPKAYKQIGHK